MRPQAGRRAAMPPHRSCLASTVLLLATISLGHGSRVLHEAAQSDLAGQVTKGVSGALSQLGLPSPQNTGAGALQEGRMSATDGLPSIESLDFPALAPSPIALPQELATVKTAVGKIQDSAARVAKQFQAQQDEMAAAVNHDQPAKSGQKVAASGLPVVPLSANDLTTLTQTLQAAETVQQFLQKLPQQHINTEATPITKPGQYSTAQAPLGQFTIGSPAASLNFYQGAAKLPAEAQKTINQIVDAFTPTVNKFTQTIRGMLPAPSPPPPPPVISAAIDRVGQVAVDRISQILSGDGIPAGGIPQPVNINPSSLGRRRLSEEAMPAILEGVDPNFNPTDTVNGARSGAVPTLQTPHEEITVAAGPAVVDAPAPLGETLAPVLAPAGNAAPSNNPLANLPNSVSHDLMFPLVQAVQNSLTPVLAPAIGPNPITGPITVTPVTEMPVLDGSSGSPQSAPVPIGQPQLPNIAIPSIAGTIRLPGVAIPQLPPIGAPLAFNPDNDLIWTNPGGSGHTGALTMGRKLQQEEEGNPPPPPPPPPPPADGSLGRAHAAAPIAEPVVVIPMAQAADMAPTADAGAHLAPALAPSGAVLPQAQPGALQGIGLPLPALPGVATLGLPPLQAVTVTVNPERLFAPLSAPGQAPMTGPGALPTADPTMSPSEGVAAADPRPMPRPEMPGSARDAQPYPTNQRLYMGRKLQQDEPAPPPPPPPPPPPTTGIYEGQVGIVDPALLAPSHGDGMFVAHTVTDVAAAMAPVSASLQVAAPGLESQPMQAEASMMADAAAPAMTPAGSVAQGPAGERVSFGLPEVAGIAVLGLPPLQGMTVSLNPAEVLAPLANPYPFPIPQGAVNEDGTPAMTSEVGPPQPGPEGPGAVRPQPMPVTQGRRLQQIVVADAATVPVHGSDMAEEETKEATAPAPAPSSQMMALAGAPHGLPLPALPAVESLPPMQAGAVGPLAPAQAPRVDRAGPGPLPGQGPMPDIGPMQLPRPEIPGTAGEAQPYPALSRTYQGRRLAQAQGPAPGELPGSLPRPLEPMEPGTSSDAVAYPAISRQYQGRRLTQTHDDEEVYSSPPPPPPPPPPPADGSLGPQPKASGPSAMTHDAAVYPHGDAASPAFAAPIVQPAAAPTILPEAAAPSVRDLPVAAAAPVALPELEHSVSAVIPQASGPMVGIAAAPGPMPDLAQAVSALLPLSAGPMPSTLVSDAGALPAPEAEPSMQAAMPRPAMPDVAGAPSSNAVPAPLFGSEIPLAPAYGPSSSAPAPLPNRLPELPEVQALGLPRMPEINLPNNPSELLPFTVGYGPNPAPRVAPISVTMGRRLHTARSSS